MTNNDASGTSPQYANVPEFQHSTGVPRNMRLTPRGASTAPVSRVFPQIRGGQCEFCGTLDNRMPGDQQYKLCPHYRGMNMRCVYCPDNKDQDEVVRVSTLNVREHPYRPGELLVWCNSFECTKKHREAFEKTH